MNGLVEYDSGLQVIGFPDSLGIFQEAYCRKVLWVGMCKYVFADSFFKCSMTHSIGKFINGVSEVNVWIFNDIIKYVKKKSHRLKRCHKCEPGSEGSFHHNCLQICKILLDEGEQQECKQNDKTVRYDYSLHLHQIVKLTPQDIKI